MVESSDTLSTPDLVTQIAALAFQVQENTNRFMALMDENKALRQENYNLLEHLSAIETTSQQSLDH